MKPQTLIPLSEYVDKVREIPKMLSKDKVKLIYDFSDKLKLIPTIADFIPCVLHGEKWNVIEKPEFTTDTAITELSKLQPLIDQYQTALNNVKFSGWEVSSITESLIYIRNEEIWHILVFYKENGLIADGLLYSDLTTLNIPLTERGMEYFNINI